MALLKLKLKIGIRINYKENLREGGLKVFATQL